MKEIFTESFQFYLSSNSFSFLLSNLFIYSNFFYWLFFSFFPSLMFKDTFRTDVIVDNIFSSDAFCSSILYTVYSVLYTHALIDWWNHLLSSAEWPCQLVAGSLRNDSLHLICLSDQTRLCNHFTLVPNHPQC